MATSEDQQRMMLEALRDHRKEAAKISVDYRDTREAVVKVTVELKNNKEAINTNKDDIKSHGIASQKEFVALDKRLSAIEGEAKGSDKTWGTVIGIIGTVIALAALVASLVK